MKNQAQKKSQSKSAGKKKQKVAERSRKGVLQSAPVIQSRIVKTGVPRISSSDSASDGRVRIRHREFLGDVSGSVGFSVSGYPINPGIVTTFPWLSAIANRFESYLFRRLSFEYETAAASTTVGTVMLAVDYDAADTPPINKVEIMSYHNAVRCGVWQEASYGSDQFDLKKFGVQRYVRGGPLSPNLDIKTYDVGNLFLATKGESDDSVIGELYVSYDVELMTPQFQAGALGGLCHLTTSGASRAVPFANTVAEAGSFPWATTDNVSKIIFNSSGTYLITVATYGTAFNGNDVNLSNVSCLVASITPTGHMAPDGSSGLWSFTAAVVSPGATSEFDFVTPNCCTTLTSCNIFIAKFA